MSIYVYVHDVLYNMYVVVALSSKYILCEYHIMHISTTLYQYIKQYMLAFNINVSHEIQFTLV